MEAFIQSQKRCGQTVESSGLELKILRPWCPRPDKRGGDTINHILWLRHQCYWLFNVYLTTQHFLVALRLRDHELLGATGLPSAEREGARQHEGVHQRHHQPAAGHRPGPTLLLSVPGPGHSDRSRWRRCRTAPSRQWRSCTRPPTRSPAPSARLNLHQRTVSTRVS